MNNNDQFTAAPACYGHRLRGGGWMVGRRLNAAQAVVPLGVADGNVSDLVMPDGHSAAIDLLRELESRVRERDFTLREARNDQSPPGSLIDSFNAVIEAIERTVFRSESVIRSARDAIVTFNADDRVIVG